MMKRNKNLTRLAALLAVVFIVGSGMAEAQQKPKVKGEVPLDFPNAPEAKIEIDLSGKLLSLFAKSAQKQEPQIHDLFAMISVVYIRGYDGDTANLNQIVRYYENRLKQQKWEVIAKVKERNETVQVRLLLDGEMIRGLFIIVASAEETIIMNIFGSIDFEKIGDLLGNLDNMNLDFDMDWEALKKLEIDAEAKKKIEDK